MEEVKPWYLSKTILVNIFMAVAMIIAQFKPETAEVVKHYLGEAGVAWAVINIVLRIVTKDKIGIS